MSGVNASGGLIAEVKNTEMARGDVLAKPVLCPVIEVIVTALISISRSTFLRGRGLLSRDVTVSLKAWTDFHCWEPSLPSGYKFNEIFAAYVRKQYICTVYYKKYIHFMNLVFCTG